MKKVTLRNKFHGTTMIILADDEMVDSVWGVIAALEDRVYQKDDMNAKRRLHNIWKNLCGVKDCKCCWSFVEEIR